jgi:Ser/Thr protein kinase RdoA (MazF antagonist)
MAIQYDLSVPLEARLVRSWMNEVYELRTSRGRYALKVYRRGWRSVDQAVYEAELALHLAGHGLAVARPVRRRDGTFVGTLAAPEGQRAIALTEWLNGRTPVPPDEAIYERVGRTIAAMHNSLDTFNSTRPRLSFDVVTLAEEPLRWISRICGIARRTGHFSTPSCGASECTWTPVSKPVVWTGGRSTAMPRSTTC